MLAARTVDKYLRPVRAQIVDLIEPGTSIIELGCGNGDLLYKLQPKIKYGIGLDLNKSLLHYASKRKGAENITNLDFEFGDLRNQELKTETYDYSIASLLLHVLPRKSSLQLLERMMGISSKTIICTFVKPETWKQNALLWFDQRFTGHYRHFKNYKQHNFMYGLLEDLGIRKYECLATFDSVIKIFIVG